MKQMGVSAWIDEQLRPPTRTDTALATRLAPLEMLSMDTDGVEIPGRGSDSDPAPGLKGFLEGGGPNVPAQRFIHPSLVDFRPGVPLSMKSCASKCDRVRSGEPMAWTMPRWPSR